MTVSYLSISPQESVWYWNVDIKSKAANNSTFHRNELVLLVCIIAYVNKVIHTGWVSFLAESKGNFKHMVNTHPPDFD